MLNEALRLVRIYHDHNQSEMAGLLEISKSYLSEIEKGVKKPTLQLLQKYSDVLGIPLSSLVFFAEELQGVKHPSRSHIFVADKVLKFLKLIARDEPTDTEPRQNRPLSA